MATEHIIMLLIQERDRLTRAIEALQGPTKRMGRPPKAEPGMEGGGAPAKRKLSAAARRNMRAAQKKRWAAKKAEK
jgi:hypothetical protein